MYAKVTHRWSRGELKGVDNAKNKTSTFQQQKSVHVTFFIKL